MRIAVIPARGGSKRIPRKNIKLFGGKPIIAWSIEAAIKSGCFEKVVVSTEDDEIVDVAKSFGAEVPFKRPSSLADDYTGINSVIAHSVEWFQNQGVNLEWVCCLYATAPLIKASDIQAGLKIISEKHCDYVFSVTNYVFPIQRALKLTTKGKVKMLYPEYFNTRSQDLEEAFHDAGQFYWGRPEVWKQGRSIFSSNSFPVVIPRYRVQDIDTQEDWTKAEIMFKASDLILQNQ